jgi:murein tripeptide amidase MpaA
VACGVPALADARSVGDARLAAVSLAARPVAAPRAAVDETLRTTAELTRYARTGRYDEVERLCRAFESAWPAQVRCVTFGTTPERRPMLALVASADGVLTPEDARARGRPVVLVQAGIHAGEIDGKDAGFEMLRDALQGRVAPGALAGVTWVFVPVFNVDGHERFGAWHRPNQVGPAEMGWRSTAQNLNLNRDYTKADAPEMRALLAFVNAWDPVVYADLHTTDGANFEHDVSVQVQPDQSEDAALAAAGRELRDALLGRLAATGSLPLPFYPSFVATDRPESGFTYAPYAARFQTGYWPLSNRVALLVETHSWKDYATRVRVTREFLAGLLERVAAEPVRWTTLAMEADARARALGGTPVVLAWENTPDARTIEFRGYAYARRPSPVSGALAIAYDPKRPEIWRVPLRDQVRPTVSVTLPRGGYVVPAAWAADLEPRLRAHGLAFETWSEPRTGLSAEVFRLTKFAAGTPYEGRTTTTLAGAWAPAPVDLAAGALYVPIAQPKARLVAALFEPQAPDSFVAWGLFNGAFERKEYMEAYVAEEVARELLAKDPALAREFERRLLTDPAFAASPAARLEFFERRHPSWDARPETYPVYRADATH